MPQDSALRALPVISENDLRDKGSLRLANYFADLRKQASDAKEARRAANPDLRQKAMVYTLYFRAFVTEHQRTGIGREAYRKANPVNLPGEQPRYLKASAFGWRLRVFLNEIGAVNETSAVLSEMPLPILRLVDDRYVNPGAKFELADGPTLLILDAIDNFPNVGYRNLHNAVVQCMDHKDFAFKGLWPYPTESQVRTLQAAVPEALRVFLREGYKIFYGMYGLARTRERGELNHIWAGDAFYLNDVRFFDPENPKAGSKKPGISYILELSSRFMLSYDVRLESTEGLIGVQLLRDAVLPREGEDADLHPIYGKFRYLLSDGGVPLGTDITTTTVRMLGAEPLIIPKGKSAQNGRAERFGRTFKILIRSIIMAQLRKDYPAFARGGKFPIQQFDLFKQIVAKAIARYNYSKIHRDLKMTPHEAAMRAVEKTPIQPHDPEYVMRITSVGGTAKVQKEGILFKESWFFAEELKDLVGETIEYVFDPFNKEDRFLTVIHHGIKVCDAPLKRPGTSTSVREAINGPLNDFHSKILDIGHDLRRFQKLMFKPVTPSVEEALNAQKNFPDLVVPLVLKARPDLFTRTLGPGGQRWQSGVLADTHALRVAEQAARDVAGKKRVVTLKAPAGNGLTFLCGTLVERAAKLEIPGNVLHVELLSPDDGKHPYRRIFSTLGLKKTPDDVRQVLADKGIGLLIVDNAHFLSDDFLRSICGLPRRRVEKSRSVQTELGLPPPPKVDLGVILVGRGFNDTQITIMRESCEWDGLNSLPHLSFEEMAALLGAVSTRFEPILDAAKVEDTPEMKFLATFYSLTEGAFARFEHILRRLEPILKTEGPLSVDAMTSILDKYSTDTLAPRKPGPRRGAVLNLRKI